MNDREPIPGLGFVIGGLAACGAVTFTNPWEVVKTRLQLQGELMRSAQVKRVYRGVGDAFIKIASKEGLSGLQRGLIPAYLYQLVMNGVRFGGYDSLKSFMTSIISPEDYRAGRMNTLANIISGALAGTTGAAIGTPFFLIKTRIQAYSPNLAAVGTVQHRYRGMTDAFRSIVHTDGWRGLLAGVEAAMLRTGIGSGIQLATYDRCRHFAVDAASIPDNAWADFAAALASGLMVCLGMNPFDVVTTRMYNQDRRNPQYRSPIDCLAQTVRAEGFRGLYKGFSANYFRVGPHTILCFVFLGQMRILAKSQGLL